MRVVFHSVQSLRTQEAHRLLRVEHEARLEELESTYKELLRVEKRLDRLKSSTVQAMEATLDPAPPPAETASNEVKPEPASGLVVPKVEAGNASPSPGPMVGVQELEDLRSQLIGRIKDLEEVREDRVALRREMDALKAKVR